MPEENQIIDPVQENSIKASRRKLLKTVGSTATLSALGGIAYAAEGNSIGTVHFVEAGFKYDVSSNGDFDRWHVDEPSKYFVKPDEQEVYLLQRVSAEEKRLFTNGSGVANFGELRSFPAIVSKRTTKSLTTALGSQYRPNKTITLEEPLQKPSARLHRENDDVVVQTLNTEENIAVGNERTFSLPSQEATVRTVEVLDTYTKHPEIPEEQRGVETKFKPKLVQVTPQIVVKNHGTVSVVDWTGSNDPVADI